MNEELVEKLNPVVTFWGEQLEELGARIKSSKFAGLTQNIAEGIKIMKSLEALQEMR